MSVGALDRCLEALRVFVTSDEPTGQTAANTAVEHYIAAAGPSPASQIAALHELEQGIREAIPEPAASELISSVERHRLAIEDALRHPDRSTR